MPYKDPAKQREYVRNSRKRFNDPPSMEEPRLYWVVLGRNGPVITQDTSGGTMAFVPPMTLTEAIAAYVKAGGVGIDLNLE